MRGWHTRFLILVSAALCLAMAMPSAQSLRERAKREGGKASTIMGDDLPVVQTRELMADSDLVLRAQIIEAKSHVGPDETYVVTDYVIAPIQVLKQKRLITAARPGETTEIVVRRAGGKTTEGGFEFSTIMSTYPESESFQVGDDILVFLQYDSSGRVYSFTGGPFGAFRVQNNQVHPMTREVARRRGDKPVELTKFVNDLVGLSR